MSESNSESHPESSSESNFESNFESKAKSSSGVYKSKLFNFLNRRSQQLKDQSKAVLRHLQVATIWGVQIAFYPVYLLIQTTRNFAFQLRESAALRKVNSLGEESSDRPNLPPAVDEPITQTLKLVKELLVNLLPSSLPPLLPASPILELSQGRQDLIFIPNYSNYNIDANSQIITSKMGGDQENLAVPLKEENSLGSQGFFIQGVANLITSRTLVLVDINNQILDILTPEQQQKIAQRIIWEVASYRYDRQRFFQVQKFLSPQLPDTRSPKTLLPARWFWQLMAWVQRGEVAIAANLFQESSLSVVTPSLTSFIIPDFPSLTISTATLQAFDQQLYQIEIDKINPASKWLSRIGEKLLPVVVYPEQLFTHQEEIANPNSQHQGNIWALIQGAIAYFLGQKSSSISSSMPTVMVSDYDLTSPSNALYSVRESIPKYQELPFSEDDWLTSSDLFKTPSSSELISYKDEAMEDIEAAIVATAALIAPPVTADIKLLPQGSHPLLVQSMIHQKKEAKSRFSFLTKRKNVGQISPKLDQVTTTSKPSQSENKPRNQSRKEGEISRETRQEIRGVGYLSDQSTNLDNPNPDWLDLETEVTPKGYVKHPLQQCLEILDNITLWIEKFFGRIWIAIKKFVRI